MSEKICCEGKGGEEKSLHAHNLSLTVTKSIGFTEPRKFNSSAFITKIGLGDLSLSNKAALDPSFPSFKTQRGWDFFIPAKSSCLSIVGTSQWPRLSSQALLPPGAQTSHWGVKQQMPALHQHSASLRRPDSLFMHHGFIWFNEKPRAKLQVFVFFVFFFFSWRPLYRMCPDIHSGN